MSCLEFPTRKGNLGPYRFWTKKEIETLKVILNKHRKGAMIRELKEAFPYRSISSITNRIKKFDEQGF